MRVISGSLKGKSISYLKNLITRPLKDSVKENIFNILNHSNLINVKIKNANVLDLYSGFGSFGIECISRGAKKITFVEHNKSVANILKKNLTQLSVIDQIKLINKKVEDSFENLKNEKFNIFFLDPPFADNDYLKNLILIKKLQIIEKKHIVVIHRERKKFDNLNKIINPIFEKNYGRSKIIFGFFN